jgi:hypothetical protein
MVKKTLIAVCTFFFVLATVSSVTAIEYADLNVNGPICRDDGSFSFEAQNSKLGQLQLEEVKVRAKHVVSNHSFLVPGSFSQNTIHGKESFTRRADFQSHKGLFNETGRYAIEIEYPNCKYPPCNKKVTLHNCPGFVYDCSLAHRNFKITKCVADENTYSVSFEGLHKDQYTKLNIEQNVLLYFHSSARKLEAANYLKGRQIKDNGKDSYLLRFPRMQHEEATFLALGFSPCSREQVVSCKINETQSPASFSQPTPPTLADTTTPEQTESGKSTEASTPVKEVKEEEPTEELNEPLFLALGIAVALLILVILILVAVVLLRE